MVAENTTKSKPSLRARILPWLNVLLAVVLVGVGIWFLAGKVSLADILIAIRQANTFYIALGLGVMLLTVVIKTWRWQLMLVTDGHKLPFLALFWATMLGQYVNLIVPFMRLGEVARVYALKQQTQVGVGRALGTLVLEKALDLTFFAVTVILILPFVILPDFLGDPGLTLGALALTLLVLLYLMAYQTAVLRRFLQALSDRIPLAIWKRLMRLFISGLEGLQALRNTRLSILLIGSSMLVAFLAALLPALLFPAFDLHLSLVQGALMHIVVSVASTPPSTPARIGVFNGAAAFMLYSYGITDEAAIVGYAIVFHLVVMLPQIILGSVAAWRTDWHWQKSVETQIME